MPVKRICLLLLVLLMLPVPTAWGEPEAVTAARSSVAQVYGMGLDADTGQQIRWTGTAFAVGTAGEESEIFLTNWHVATGSGRCQEGSVELWLLLPQAEFDARQVPLADSAVACQVLATTDGYPDVAVLRAASPLPGCTALPLLSSRQVLDGTQVYALGFPGLKSIRDTAPAAITQGSVTDHLVMTRAGNTRSIIHSAPIRHGFSGGPLVNQDGAVVAQNTYGFEEDVTTELFCAVYTDYAMKLLDGLDIPYTRLTGPAAATVFVANLLHRPDLSPALAWALLALALLAGIAFLLCFVKTALEAGRELRQRRREYTRNQHKKEVQ